MRGRGGELGAQRGAIRRSLRPLLPARRRAPPAEAPPSTAPRFSRGPRRLRFPPSLDPPPRAVCYALLALSARLLVDATSDMVVSYRPQLLYSNVSPKLRIQGQGFKGALARLGRKAEGLVL